MRERDYEGFPKETPFLVGPVQDSPIYVPLYLRNNTALLGPKL